ncbi:MAG: hypothetical protein ACLGG0_08845 [Bacteriovoracia bacterium]
MTFSPEDASVYKLTILAPDGTEFDRKYTPVRDGEVLEVIGGRIKTIQATHSESRTIKLSSEGEADTTIEMINGLVKFPEAKSARNSIKILGSIAFVSFIVGLLFYLVCSYLASGEIQILARTFLGFSPILITFSVIAFALSPGLFGNDAFYNFQSATRYEFSSFVGTLYSSVSIVLYQLVPRFWIMSMAHIFVVIACLFGFYTYCERRERRVLFYISVSLFLIYPGNLGQIFYVGRDTAASWIFCLTLFRLCILQEEKSKSFNSFLLLGLLLAVAIMLRQETGFILVPCFLAVSFFSQQSSFKKNLVLLSIVLAVVLSIGLISRPSSSHLAKYKATLLINPLSYILKKKYGDSLPSEVSANLGSFFKNEYLVRYQSDFDIDPFHKGGVNQSFKIEQFEKFMNQAFLIFWENKGYFLENRLKVGSKMLGFTNDKPSFDDRYFDTIGHAFQKIKLRYSMPDAPRSKSGWLLLAWYKDSLLRLTTFIGQSYLIPIFTICIYIFFSRKARALRIVSAFLLARTLLVCAIAPAAYYRYQFPLWIFSLFGLVVFYDQYIRKTVAISYKTE